MLYDGRGFLRQASAGVDECRPGVTVPTYDSQGLLHRRSHLSLLAPTAPPSETDTIFYFAGRPVATLRLAPSSFTLTYLTTDHLGTPILATADTGTLVWQGGFEPFGENWNGASAAGVFLRFPGQWVDQVWESARLESGLYYNVWRWYGWGVGRYGQADPMGLASGLNLYEYAGANPMLKVDPLGLQARDAHVPTREEIVEQTQRSCARRVFYRNYDDMIEANWKKSDKYFHCKANCEATKCGDFGYKEACELSDLREFGDRLFKGDPPSASAADQVANRFGREQAQRNSNATCQILCAQYRPDGLPQQY